MCHLCHHPPNRFQTKEPYSSETVFENGTQSSGPFKSNRFVLQRTLLVVRKIPEPFVSIAPPSKISGY